MTKKDLIEQWENELKFCKRIIGENPTLLNLKYSKVIECFLSDLKKLDEVESLKIEK